MRTILLADDETNLRTLVRTTLEDPELRILESASGPTTLEMVRRERPDLLLLDWMMPGMTGIEVMKALRLDPETAGLAVIMLTAKGQEKDRLEALALGAVAYLVKPFSPLQLLGKVREVLDSASKSVQSARDLPAMNEEIRRQLDQSDTQLAYYARDLRRVLESERQKAAELADANERLKTLNILKSDFLSFVSHELRTPLNALSGVRMFDPKDDPKVQAELADITRSGYESLQTFIDRGLRYFNWLAIEKVETTATTDLLAVVESAADQVVGLRASGVDFRIQHGPGRFIVRGEGEDLEEVVCTLLDNAIKFSPHEKRVRVRLESTESRHVLSVADQGVGLAPQTGRDLFQPCTIADVNHHSSGTGLSLAITGAIVRAHGGRIGVESPGLGRGSVFSVELPVALASAESVDARNRGGNAA